MKTMILMTLIKISVIFLMILDSKKSLKIHPWTPKKILSNLSLKFTTPTMMIDIIDLGFLTDNHGLTRNYRTDIKTKNMGNNLFSVKQRHQRPRLKCQSLNSNKRLDSLNLKCQSLHRQNSKHLANKNLRQKLRKQHLILRESWIFSPLLRAQRLQLYR